MKLENYEVHLPNYSIGDKIYDKIGPVCESYGKKVLIIGSRRALKAAEDKIRAYVAKTNLEIIGTKLYGTDCTYAAVEKLRELPEYEEADMVFGVGGGKALDTVKCLCITDDKPVFAFPTIASNCAACTSVSIMYNEDGTFLKPNFFVRPVMHSFIDTEIIAKAPSQYMWAGIGDTYAKYYEAAISSRDERLEHFTSLGVVTSHMCRDPLLMYGAKALEDHKKGLCTYEVEQAVLAEKNGADYLGVGAVFTTGSKADADDVPIDTLKKICEAVSIPVVAIGGITQENVTKLKDSGICGVAVISAIYAQKDIRKASEQLKDAVKKVVG